MTTEIECAEIIGRALRLDHLTFDDAEEALQVTADAFLLRVRSKPPRSEDGWTWVEEHRAWVEAGLSVSRRSLEAFEETLTRPWLESSVAMASLHTGRVRTLAIDVVADPLPTNPAHAVVVKVPMPIPFTAAHNDAITMSVQLSEMARPTAWRNGEPMLTEQVRALRNR